MSQELDIAKAYIPPERSLFQYTPRDAIIYALGIGVSVSDSLHFLYENHPNFQVFPTFVVAPGLLANQLADWPGLHFDLSRVLHGEHFIEVFGVLPSDGCELQSEMRLLDVVDKGSGILIITQVSTFDQGGTLLARQRFGIFQMGETHLVGLSRTSLEERKPPSIPKDRTPDVVLHKKVSPDQAALYRLGSSDLNPLHIDADFSNMVGFSKPILHGLCTLGIATSLVLREFGANNAENFQSVQVRFSAPVLPGQTLSVECWRDLANNNGVHFQAKVLETGKIVLTSGYIALRINLDQLPPPKTSEREHAQRIESKEIFELLKAELSQINTSKFDSDDSWTVTFLFTKNGQVKAVYTFKVDGPNKSISIDEGLISNNDGALHREPLIPSISVTIDDNQFIAIIKDFLSKAKNKNDDADKTGKEMLNTDRLSREKYWSMLFEILGQAFARLVKSYNPIDNPMEESSWLKSKL